MLKEKKLYTGPAIKTLPRVHRSASHDPLTAERMPILAAFPAQLLTLDVGQVEHCSSRILHAHRLDTSTVGMACWVCRYTRPERGGRRDDRFTNLIAVTSALQFELGTLALVGIAAAFA